MAVKNRPPRLRRRRYTPFQKNNNIFPIPYCACVFFLTNTIIFRIFYRMKVTALIPDKLVHDIKQYTGAKNITESLIVALNEWLALKKVKELNILIKKHPLRFSSEFSSSKVREI